MIPEMERKGYPRDSGHGRDDQRFGAGDPGAAQPQRGDLFSGGGRHGLRSPPCSWPVSCPGPAQGLTLAVLCLYFAKRKNYPKGDVIPLRQALKISVDAFWGLITIVIILGGILSGAFTANESASIAVSGLSSSTMFNYRDSRWSDLPRLLHRTVKTVTIVMILIGFAASFGYVMTLMQIPLKVTTSSPAFPATGWSS